MAFTCRIIVLNFNGRALLERCLPSIQIAATNSRYACKITVLDNRSADNSEEVVTSRFPEIEYVTSRANRVFCSYNEYVASISEDFVILLNNDIRVDEDFIDPLLDGLIQDADSFFTAPRSLNWETAEYEGCRSTLEMRFGLLWGTSRFRGYEKRIHEFGLTMQTGFGAFRRERFLELGGFDDLYLPGTVEDADLCFRAYRRGWKGYYCPNSIVYHMGQASFKKAFGDSGIRRLNRRNLYLFMWKNIRSPYIVIHHVLMIPLHLIKYALFGQKDFFLGFMDAVKALDVALAKRREAASQEPSHLPDEAIFAASRSLR